MMDGDVLVRPERISIAFEEADMNALRSMAETEGRSLQRQVQMLSLAAKKLLDSGRWALIDGELRQVKILEEGEEDDPQT
jgi:hypothetical protein